MDISKQVCSLQQAKRLKELGVRQESYFYWYCGFGTLQTGVAEIKSTDWYADKQQASKTNASYSAFTVAEIGVMLPATLYVKDAYCSLKCVRSGANNKYFMAMYQSVNYLGSASIKAQFAKITEAECRAAMLIHLLETKLITADEVNARLA